MTFIDSNNREFDIANKVSKDEPRKAKIFISKRLKTLESFN